MSQYSRPFLTPIRSRRSASWRITFTSIGEQHPEGRGLRSGFGSRVCMSTVKGLRAGVAAGILGGMALLTGAVRANAQDQF